MTEPGLSGWPSDETVMQFWAVYDHPEFRSQDKGWIIMRSERRGMIYTEGIALGGPMPEDAALHFLQEVERVRNIPYELFTDPQGRPDAFFDKDGNPIKEN